MKMMRNLSNIVSEYYPKESVHKNTKVLLKTTSRLATGREIKGFWNSISLPISMVETDKKYYFDIRPIYYSTKPWIPYLKNPINILLSLFLILFGGYFVGSLFLGSGSGFKLVIILTVALGLYLALNYKRTDANIIAIKKEWITEEKEENNEYILKWSLPNTEVGFSILHLLPKDKQDKLPSYLKFQSGLWVSLLSSFMGKLSPVSFKENTIYFTEV